MIRRLTIITLVTLFSLAGPSAPASAQRNQTVSTGDGSDQRLAKAFADRESGFQVEGEGTVTRVLPDDTDGGRHQRFIIRLKNAQTLLVAHNIDLAPRVAGLKSGDKILFNGEYEWNSQGGLIHWTHRKPRWSSS